MDAPPVSDAETKRPPAPSFPCDLCDTEAVHKIAEVLLVGLATACVDSTIGDLFRTPSSVAVDARRDLVDYLTLRSQSYPSDILLNPTPDADPDAPPDHPAEIVSDLAEDFAASRRSILSRVSGWILSESREDRIDDFVQDLESNGFWFPERRQAVAETLLRNIDFRYEFHCAEGLESEESLADHRVGCPFRVLVCGNEGCGARFCAAKAGKHDGECEYKVLECEQGCGERIVRREMDRHCITVCSMKMVNCTFYPVGCRLPVPRCRIAQHCEEFLHSHLVYVLQRSRRMEEATEDLKELALLLEKSQTDNELSEAVDVRSLTTIIKRQEAKINKLETDLREQRRQEKEKADLEEALSRQKEPEDDQSEGQNDHKMEGEPTGHREEKLLDVDNKEIASQEN